MPTPDDALDSARRMYHRVSSGWALDCLALRKAAAGRATWGAVRVAGINLKRAPGAAPKANQARDGGVRWAA